MGSAQSSMFGPEAMAAGAIVAGAAVTAIALDNGWFARSEKKSGTEENSPTAPALKKGGKKSKEDKALDKLLAGAVAERNLLEAAVLAASTTRVVGLPDVVPGSFEDASAEAPENKKKKKKKTAAKKGESAASSVLVTSPENSILQVPPAVVVANESSAPPAKKSKKRKAMANSTGAQAQAADQPSSSSAAVPAPAGTPKAKPSKANAGDDGSAWTRVELKKRLTSKRNPSSTTTALANSTTDADSAVSPITSASASASLNGDEHTTETGTEVTDKASADEEEEDTGAASAHIAVPLTGVEDMLPPPSPPARVLRVVPGPTDRPAPGFSWGDYEDADISAHDGEDEDDDEGWGVVRSRRSFRSTNSSGLSEGGGKASSFSASLKASETMTKRKRQNKSKHEQEKAEKVAAEEERLRVLREHQRGLEKLRMEQQGSSKQGKQLSGGSKASLDNSGHLVWE